MSARTTPSRRQRERRVPRSPAWMPISASVRGLASSAPVGGLGGAVVRVERVDADGRGRPFAVEPPRPPATRTGSRRGRRSRRCRGSPRASGSRRGLERLLEHVRRNADRPGEAHVRGGRIDPSFGNVGDDRRDDRVAEPLRDAPASASRARCACRASGAGRSARCRRPARSRSSCPPRPRRGARARSSPRGRRTARLARRRRRASAPAKSRAEERRGHRRDHEDRAQACTRDQGPAWRSRCEARLVRLLRAQRDVVVRADAVDERHRHAAARAVTELRLLVVLGKREQRSARRTSRQRSGSRRSRCAWTRASSGGRSRC